MSMIEVDPKLFVTCRLCLDEMGQYQIVPQVKTHIKYCFDIEVEPFDGFPQLICKKCESILSQYVGIKQEFQEKQSNLKLKVKVTDKDVASKVHQQQQNSVSLTQQVDGNDNSLINKNINIIKSTSSSRTSSVDRESCTQNGNELIKKSGVKRARSVWRDDYLKYFVCRFCTKSWKDKRSVTYHLKQCHLIRKYSNIIQRCFVKMNKVGSTTNFTSSNENVVCNKSKILNCKNKNYYILYILKSSEKSESESTQNSDSSDEDFIVSKKNRKRCRLLSKSSNETLVIEDYTASKNSLHSDDEEEKHDYDHNKNQNKLTDVTDIECVNIDDSDSASTTSNLKTAINDVETIVDDIAAKSYVVNDKVIQNIITMCYNKYLKRQEMDEKNSKGTGNIDAFLQCKILSMGRKIVIDKGLNSTGLIRFMEHKQLDVSWIPKNLGYVAIQTTLREDKCNDSNYSTWKSWKDGDKFTESKDFIDIYEETTRAKSYSPKNSRALNVETQLLEKQDTCKVKNNYTLDLNDVQNSNPQLYFDNSAKLTDQTLANPPTQTDLGQKKVEHPILYIHPLPETDKNTMLTKLLNENPVANPKQLPKKSCPLELLSLLTSSSSSTKVPTLPNTTVSNIENNNEEVTMPIITSIMSLANAVDSSHSNEEDKNHQSHNKSESEGTKSLSLPRIKVKPVSELMPEKILSQQKSAILQTNTWPTTFYNEGKIPFVQNGNTPVVYMTNGVASSSNVNSQVFNTAASSQCNMNKRPNILISPSSNASLKNTLTQESSNKQYVTMHTVELPNKRTNSPFRYFQELLQIHNMVLLHSVDIVATTMSCLIKFKLVFHQESSVAVTLCLSLYYNRNTFCIRVRDIESKHLDIAKLSAYWQWEILKEFKGDIVPRLYENSSKIGQDVLNKTTYFVSLLSSIVFLK